MQETNCLLVTYFTLPSVCLFEPVLSGLIVFQSLLDFLASRHNEWAILEYSLIERFTSDQYNFGVIFNRRY